MIRRTLDSVVNCSTDGTEQDEIRKNAHMCHVACYLHDAMTSRIINKYLLLDELRRSKVTRESRNVRPARVHSRHFD